MGKKIVDQFTGAELKPGDFADCRGNGKHDGLECCCDECDYLRLCFPKTEEFTRILV